MRNFLLFYIIGLSISFNLINSPSLFAQNENNYDAIFSSETIMEIDSYSGIVYTEEGKYIILNEEGLKFCRLRFFYGYNSDIVHISAAIKGFDGKTIKKLKKSDIKDVSANTNGSLFIDRRMKYFQITNNYFPFILEYKVVKKIKNSFYYPEWIPKMDYGLLNISSTYSLVVPRSISINYKAINIGKANIQENGMSTRYNWSVDSLPPITDEPFSYSEYWDAPRILTAPSTFHVEYQGHNNSWVDFGEWIIKLNEGRDVLTCKEKAVIDSLLTHVDSKFHKVDLLYKYLQKNTRYVSIQEGIGGWQPFSAKFVCENKYGDCKALTNYMYAMLKYIGIKSNYTLVKAGSNVADIITEFPSNQFNHAVLMVPIESDTIWLDCTSKITPTGFIERFIADRNVLVIEKSKSFIKKIPTYKREQNTENYTGTIKLNTDLSGSGYIFLESSAHRSSSSRILNKNYNSRIAEKYTDNNLNLPSYTILSRKHSAQVKNFIPYTIDSVSININIAGKKAGQELLLSYPLEFSLGNTPEKKERMTDIYLPESYIRKDSLVYIIPESYELVVPFNFKHISEFGEVKYKISSIKNKIVLQSSISVNKGRYDKEKIEEFRKFIQNIEKIESYEIIISKS